MEEASLDDLMAALQDVQVVKATVRPSLLPNIHAQLDLLRTGSQ